MRFTKILAALLITAGALAPSIAQACQWVRVGELSNSMECRSNYRHFFTDNSELFNKLLTEAAFLATGEGQKLVIDHWAIRNAVTVGDASKLLENRFESDKLINEMNAMIRQQEALDGEDDLFQLPSAYMVGVTIPINGEIAKLPFIPKMISTMIPKPGASVFIGWALIPQKVEFVLTQDGKLQGPSEYVSKKTILNPETYSQTLASILAPTADNSTMAQEGRIRVATRFVVIPSVDAKTGSDGKFKNTYLKPTLGFVFGRNLVKSHQLLNNGPAISIPGNKLAEIQKISTIGPMMMPQWLAQPVERYVDTLKIGYSYSSQDKNKMPTKDNVVQFNENVFVWLRFGDRKLKQKRVAQETTAEQVVDGKFRWGWFGVVGLSSDGESKNTQNGLTGDTLGAVAGGVSSLVSELIGRSEDALAGADPAVIEDKVEALEKSLEADDKAPESERLAPEIRIVIEQEIKVLRKALDEAEQAK